MRLRFLFFFERRDSLICTLGVGGGWLKLMAGWLDGWMGVRGPDDTLWSFTGVYRFELEIEIREIEIEQGSQKRG